MSAFALGRDPKEIRTRFILELLKERPRRRAEIEKLAEGNEYGYSAASYGVDTSKLVKSGLITRDLSDQYNYIIQPLGLQWLYARR